MDNLIIENLKTKIGKYLWPLRINKFIFLGRRLTHQWKRIYLTNSSISGAISIWDLGRERRLCFTEWLDPVSQSIIFTHGNWTELQREYFGHALKPPCDLPDHPRVLILGLGGGTMVHLAHQLLRPKNITAVELDPVVVEVAQTYMGINKISNLEFIVEDVHSALIKLQSHEKFDLIVEDIFYQGFPNESENFEREYLHKIFSCLNECGVLSFNRWYKSYSGKEIDGGQELLVKHLKELFEQVVCKKIAQRWQNEIIYAFNSNQ